MSYNYNHVKVKGVVTPLGSLPGEDDLEALMNMLRDEARRRGAYSYFFRPLWWAGKVYFEFLFKEDPPFRGVLRGVAEKLKIKLHFSYQVYYCNTIIREGTVP